MTSLSAITRANQSLSLLSSRATPVSLQNLNRPTVTNPLSMVRTSEAAAARLIATQLASAGTGSPSISLTKSSGTYEMTGSKAVSLSGTTPNSASETVALKAGAAYTISTAFGLSDSRGQMRIELVDATNKVVKSLLSGAGKTQASFNITPTINGTYTIRITGQPISKSGTTTNLYGNYQISIAQAQSKLPTKSGDKNIDALVMGGTNAWFHETGSVATKTTTPVKPGVMELQNVVGRPIKYAFMNSAFLSQLTGTDANGAAVMTDTQKKAVQDAFGYFSSIINQSFELVSYPTQADIVFGTNNQGGTSAGYAYLPNMSGNHAQYLMLANDQATNNTFTNGSYGLLTLLHEMGHTLGLKHPGNYNAGGGGTPGPYLSKADDNRRNTIMSYYGASGVSANPQTLMAYDIAALQYLYGANRNPTNTEALAKRQTTTFTDGWAGLESLWTPQGATIDLSAMTKSNIIDLRQGAFSSIAAVKNNMSLAYGSRIDAVTGGKGADQIYTAPTGNMVLSGGEGADTLYLAGTAKEWTQSGSTWTRKQAGKTIATVTATQFEAVTFYDPAKTALMRA